jgi:hypothetical protein
MVAKPVVLATRSFGSQKAAHGFFKEMLNRYPIGGRVNAQDAADLLALLERHTEFQEKLARGFDHFMVDRPPDYPSQRCFHIVTPAGGKIDFSYIHCIDRIPR